MLKLVLFVFGAYLAVTNGLIPIQGKCSDLKITSSKNFSFAEFGTGWWYIIGRSFGERFIGDTCTLINYGYDKETDTYPVVVDTKINGLGQNVTVLGSGQRSNSSLEGVVFQILVPPPLSLVPTLVPYWVPYIENDKVALLYACIETPDFPLTSVFILSRTPTLDEGTDQLLRESMVQNGINPDWTMPLAASSKCHIPF